MTKQKKRQKQQMILITKTQKGKQMVIKFLKGKRNRYKVLFGIYISRIPIYPLEEKVTKYQPNIFTINFRYKHNVYSILVNLKK